MPTEDADGTSKFLLTDDEMPANWTLKSVRAHEPDELDSALVESCSAMRALHDLDRLLAWQATWEDADDGVARNFVGRTDDPISAAAWIDELADADCDLSAIGGRVDAQPVAIASTDAAVTLSLASTSGDNGTNLVVWLTGDLVFMVVVERPRVTSSDEVMRLAERAALDVIAH